AARAAAREWAGGHATVRAHALTTAANALEAAHGEMVDLVVREVGKPVVEARQEVTRGVNILRYHAQAALDPDGETYPPAAPASPRTMLMSRRRPRGVAGLITPWNFPVAIPLWKAAPALAYGNGVVLKPSSDAIAVALRLADLLSEHLPDGLLQVTPGGGGAGQAVIEHADVVSFTGSTEVGRAVARAAAARGIPAQCEMGGLNASIVLPDADPEAAAKVIAASAMGYAGQKCTATSRVIVAGDERPVVEALAAAIEGLNNGDPADEQTAVGPVINPPARREVVDAAEQASREGGRVVTGGRALDGGGLFVEPTLVDGVDPGRRLAQEEVFGPIAAVLRARSAEEAVAISNGVPYGLVTSIFTNDLDAVLKIAAELDTGMIRVNQPTSGVDFHAPFGGEKDSSYGPREQGKAAREHYTSSHTITIGPPVG
ncbi:MAG TPA: aldehyde dehydrogenase family protein, partial [Solirubrobacteraceae bacterium]|nr:aldehyde dehydrogenase family protein [Solirubrobacteraceae bacterium]